MEPCIITLSRGFECKVSPEDYDRLREHTWSYQPDKDRGTGYAYTKIRDVETGKRRKVYMHRVITNCPPLKVVDHANRDGIDNQRGNLRVTSRKFNAANCLPYGPLGLKGVSHVAPFRYRARITVDDLDIHLGYHRNPDDAARAYDIAALTHFGAFAWINGQRGDYPEFTAAAIGTPAELHYFPADVPF